MLKRLVLSVPLAISWIIFTGQLTPFQFGLGMIFSFAILVAIDMEGENINIHKLPTQSITLIAYILRLAIDIFWSGMDVARRVLHPNLPINPGTALVHTQDDSRNPLISAISAHGITITPGELVIDFEETEDGVFMLVHSLDIEQSTMKMNDKQSKLDSDQSKRLKLIKRILGHD